MHAPVATFTPTPKHPMDMVKIHAVWAYLPSFLAVAEAQHLRRAASSLRVSPSAVSRSIGILEHRIGHMLFERSGGRLRLNPMGNRLLFTMRQVVQLVDGAVLEGESQCSANVICS